MSRDVALCFLAARPHFGRAWRRLGRHAKYVVRRAAGSLGVLAPLDDRGDFRRGLAVAIASIRRHSCCVPPILLLSSEPTVAPPPGVARVIPIDPRPFEAAERCNFSIGGLSVYFKIALFRLKGWRRIVYFDCDTLGLGDLSMLWDLDQFADRALYAVRETPEMGPWGESLGKLNTGVMVVNAPLLDDRVHDAMLDLARSGHSYDGGDQGVINAFLAAEAARYETGDLPEEYNVFVNDRIGARWPRLAERAKLLHFVGPVKPWSTTYARDCPFGRDFKARWDVSGGNAC